VLSRRRFLLGSGAAAVLAACGGGADDDEPAIEGSTATTAAGSDPGLVLGEAFDRNGLLVAGMPQRAPFVLFRESGGLVPVAEAPPEVRFTLTPQGGEPLPAIRTARRGDDVERPYYPLVATFPAAGPWAVEADLGDGTLLTSSVIVNQPDEVAVPQVGEALPVAPTPTTAAPLGVTNLCTQDPICGFHEVSLDAALAAGRPVAVLVSTPEFCQVGICGPVLDLLTAAAPSHPQLDVVHVEVYTEGGAGQTGPVSPIVSETFSLQYEPVLFVADATGTIRARLDNIYDGAELADALATAAAG
jgi:hypothetical protein